MTCDPSSLCPPLVQGARLKPNIALIWRPSGNIQTTLCGTGTANGLHCWSSAFDQWVSALLASFTDTMPWIFWQSCPLPQIVPIIITLNRCLAIIQISIISQSVLEIIHCTLGLITSSPFHPFSTSLFAASLPPCFIPHNISYLYASFVIVHPSYQHKCH